MSPLDFLTPVNVAVGVLKSLIDQLNAAQDRKDRETTSVTADLVDLTTELRKTHVMIVKLVSPLRRLKDDAQTFGPEFKAVYDDFRDVYDAYDFGAERMRCHKVEQVKHRLQRRKLPFGSSAQWTQLFKTLDALGTADFDLIDQQYKPFMAHFNGAMQSIEGQVRSGKIGDAIAAKNSFLDSLGPEFDNNKALLEQMTDMVGTLTAKL